MSTTTTSNVGFTLFSQTDLENIISVSGIAIWEYDLVSKVLKLNNNWTQLLGFEPNDMEIKMSMYPLVILFS